MSDIRVRWTGDAKSALLAGKQVEQQFDRVDRQAVKTRSSLDSMIASLGTKALVGAAAGVGLVGTAVGVAGFKFDALKQQAQTAFTVMLGDGAKAKAFLDDLAQFAAKTPFEFPDLIRASQRMLSMGFAAKDIKPTLTAVGDAVAAIGGDPQAMDATIRALGQIQAKGRLMAEEMMQLNEAGTFSWKNLAAAIGTDVPKAMELVRKGAVDSDTFMKAFVTNTEQRLGGMMEKQSHSFNGLLSTIKDTFAQVSGRVMEPFFEDTTAGMQRLVDYTSSPEFTAGVERFADFMRDEASPAIKDGIGWLIDHRREFTAVLRDAADYARGLADGLRDVHKMIGPLVEAAGGWDDVAKIAFGIAMLKRVQSLTAGFTAMAGKQTATGGTGLFGAAAGARAFNLALLPLLALDLHDTPLGKSARNFWDENFGWLTDASEWLDDKFGGNNFVPFSGWGNQADPTPTIVKPTRVPGPDEGTRGRGGSGARGKVNVPTDWANPGAGHAGGQTSGLPLGRTQGPRDLFVGQAWAGTELGAPESGTVVYYDPTGAQGGGSMYFAGDSGTTYWLGHIAIADGVSVDDHVKAGQTIAVIADVSGEGVTPHLHIDKTTKKVSIPGAPAGPTPPSLPAGSSTAAKRPAESPTTGMKIAGAAGAGGDGRFVVDEVAVAVGQLRGTLTRMLGDGLISDDEMGRVKTRLQGLKGTIAAGVLAAAEAANDASDRFTQAWDKFVGLALTAFDKAHQKLRERLQAAVTFDGIEFQFGSGDLTPTEKLLADMDKAAKEAQLQAAVDAAATEEERGQAVLAQQRYFLEEKARLERKAAEDALAAKQAAFDDQTELDRVNFEKDLGAVQMAMADRSISYDEGLTRIQGIFEKYQVPFEEKSSALGSALSVALTESLGALETTLGKLVTAIEALVRRMGGQVEIAKGFVGAMQQYRIDADTAVQTITTAPGYRPYWTGGIVGYVGKAAQGMRIPGTFTPVDSLIARVSPGELISTPAQAQRALWAMMNGEAGPGRGASPVFNFYGHVWDRDELIEDVRREFRRIFRENGSIFGAS